MTRSQCVAPRSCYRLALNTEEWNGSHPASSGPRRMSCAPASPHTKRSHAVQHRARAARALRMPTWRQRAAGHVHATRRPVARTPSGTGNTPRSGSPVLLRCASAVWALRLNGRAASSHFREVSFAMDCSRAQARPRPSPQVRSTDVLDMTLAGSSAHGACRSRTLRCVHNGRPRRAPSKLRAPCSNAVQLHC